MEVLDTRDFSQVTASVKPSGRTGDTCTISKRRVELDIRYCGNIIFPFPAVCTCKRSDAHAFTLLLLVIIIEYQHSVVIAENGIRLIAWTSEIARIHFAFVYAGIGIIYVICIVFCTCATSKGYTFGKHVSSSFF